MRRATSQANTATKAIMPAPTVRPISGGSPSRAGFDGCMVLPCARSTAKYTNGIAAVPTIP